MNGYLSRFCVAVLLASTAGLALANGSAHHWGGVFQRAEINDILGIDPTMVVPAQVGAAWLIRSRNGVRGSVMTNVANAGAPYSVWFVVFNHPSACAGDFVLGSDGDNVTRCNGGDLGNAAVGGSVFYAGGAISAPNMAGGGVIHVDVEAAAGRLPKGIFNPVGRGIRRGNGYGVEVHVVVNQHVMDTDWVQELTQPETNAAAAVFLPAH